MAIVNPEFVMVDRAQDVTVTVTVSSDTSLVSWVVLATVRAYKGGPILASKTIAGGDIVPDYTGGIQSWVITFDTTDTDQEEGGYVWEFVRTDTGAEYKIIEASAFVIRGDAANGGPTCTNLSEYVIQALSGVIPPEAQAKQITQQLYAAEDQLKAWTGRDFVYRAGGIEYYDGSGTNKIVLRRTPIAVTGGITSVKLDWGGGAGKISGSFNSTTTLTEGDDFYIEPDSLFGDNLCYSGILNRTNDVWPLRQHRPVNRLAFGLEALPGCIQVTYSAGYQLIPYRIKRAVWDIASYARGMAASGRLPMSQSGEGYSRSFGMGFGDARDIASVAGLVATLQRLY